MMKKEDYLAKVSIFSYFRKKDLQRLAKRSRYFSFEIGDVIINEEENDGRFFILINGKVDVIKSYGTRKQRLLRTLSPHSYFGEMALFDDLVRSATVVAKEDVKTLCLGKMNLYKEIEKYPQLAIDLLQMLNRRLVALEKAVIKTIGGFIPICSNCKKIRDENGRWASIDHYIMDYTEHELSHGICPECSEMLYGPYLKS
ncbi:MAG: cyclic nucleotide-binding domain-containing protein [Desulfobacterales bacterium]|jgi:CRP-like cAMP-binding protein